MAIVIGLWTVCPAQPTTAPATQPERYITITAVDGINQGRATPDQQWIKLEVGMKLPMGGEIRNGTRSAVRLTVAPHQEVTLDRLGMYRIEPEMRGTAPTTGPLRITSTSTLRVYSGPPRVGEFYSLPSVTTRPARAR